MSTTLEPNTQASTTSIDTTTHAAANRIRENFAACRIKFKWLGTTKTLSTGQKSQAAESFGAECEWHSKSAAPGA